MHRETMWQFETANFTVTAYAVPDEDCDLSWADAEEIEAIRSGRHVVFGTIVEVTDSTDRVISSDSLCGSVYADAREFFVAHRDRDPMNRNCTLYRIARGGSPDAKVAICHRFPDMVRQAISEARATAKRIAPIAA